MDIYDSIKVVCDICRYYCVLKYIMIKILSLVQNFEILTIYNQKIRSNIIGKGENFNIPKHVIYRFEVKHVTNGTTLFGVNFMKDTMFKTTFDPLFR